MAFAQQQALHIAEIVYHIELVMCNHFFNSPFPGFCSAWGSSLLCGFIGRQIIVLGGLRFQIHGLAAAEIAPVVAGGNAETALEGTGKVKRAAVIQPVADLSHRETGGAQQLAGPPQPHLLEIFHGGAAGILAEHPDEIVFGKPQAIRQLVQGKGVVVGGLQQVHRQLYRGLGPVAHGGVQHAGQHIAEKLGEQRLGIQQVGNALLVLQPLPQLLKSPFGVPGPKGSPRGAAVADAPAEQFRRAAGAVQPEDAPALGAVAVGVEGVGGNEKDLPRLYGDAGALVGAHPAPAGGAENENPILYPAGRQTMGMYLGIEARYVDADSPLSQPGASPNKTNPNLTPVGDGFGFVVYTV